MAKHRPLLTVIVPTIGRAGLERTLRSIAQQGGIPPSEVEVLVIGDSFQRVPALDHARDLTEQFGYSWREFDGGMHLVGHPQRNYGQAEARGEWLAWMADDDIYTPTAFKELRMAMDRLGEPEPLLFRVDHWIGWPVWFQRGALAEGNIDAECIVVPNVPEKLGEWTARYEGDADFIIETVRRWGRVSWEWPIIARCRPQVHEDWTVQPQAVTV